MSVAEKGMRAEIIDHNVIPDEYVTYILDMWRGERTDPAVEVQRCIGVWRAEDLEDAEGNAVDPDWSTAEPGRYGSPPRVAGMFKKPLLWNILETVKEADDEAQKFQSQSASMLDNEGYSYGSLRTRKTAYQEFMAAVDRLAANDEDAEAWAIIDAYRLKQALEHEK